MWYLIGLWIAGSELNVFHSKHMGIIWFVLPHSLPYSPILTLGKSSIVDWKCGWSRILDFRLVAVGNHSGFLYWEFCGQNKYWEDKSVGSIQAVLEASRLYWKRKSPKAGIPCMSQLQFSVEDEVRGIWCFKVEFEGALFFILFYFFYGQICVEASL